MDCPFAIHLFIYVIPNLPSTMLALPLFIVVRAQLILSQGIVACIEPDKGGMRNET
jgi:hypothetical protein